MQNLTNNPSLVKSAHFGDEFIIIDLRDNTEYHCSLMIHSSSELVDGVYLNVMVPGDFVHRINPEYKITHVRAVDNRAVLTRDEMFQVISTKQYEIS